MQDKESACLRHVQAASNGWGKIQELYGTYRGARSLVVVQDTSSKNPKVTSESWQAHKRTLYSFNVG